MNKQKNVFAKLLRLTLSIKKQYVTYFKMNNYPAAKKWYKIALKIDPEYVNKRKNYFLNKKFWQDNRINKIFVSSEQTRLIGLISAWTEILQITLFLSLRGKHDRSNLNENKGIASSFVPPSFLAMTACNYGFSFWQ